MNHHNNLYVLVKICYNEIRKLCESSVVDLNVLYGRGDVNTPERIRVV